MTPVEIYQNSWFWCGMFWFQCALFFVFAAYKALKIEDKHTSEFSFGFWAICSMLALMATATCRNGYNITGEKGTEYLTIAKTQIIYERGGGNKSKILSDEQRIEALRDIVK